MFNWRLIESKCDVNWREFIWIWPEHCSISRSLVVWPPTNIGSPLWFMCAFVFRNHFSTLTANDETYAAQFLRYHYIGSDSTKTKNGKTDQKVTVILNIMYISIKINSLYAEWPFACVSFIKKKMNGTYKCDAIFERCSTHPSAVQNTAKRKLLHWNTDRQTNWEREKWAANLNDLNHHLA